MASSNNLGRPRRGAFARPTDEGRRETGGFITWREGETNAKFQISSGANALPFALFLL